VLARNANVDLAISDNAPKRLFADERDLRVR
jgi:hypothetical protein